MSTQSPYRFAIRPKWIAAHILAIVAIVGFILLGFWQLRRHDQRGELNSVITERSLAAPADLAELLGDYGADPITLEYRRVRLSGTYLLGHEVLWQARTLNGRSGHDVLTPIQTGDRAVIVNRGWVPIDVTGPPVVGAEPGETAVDVIGVIRRGQQLGGFGPTDPQTGSLDRISRVDLDRLQRQIDIDLYPFYVLLEEQWPPQPGALPALRPPPMTDAGPHFSYAFQWFIFASIAAFGYPLLLRKTARDGGSAANSKPVEGR